MSKIKSTLGGGEALLAAAFLFAFTNVLVREISPMWGDQAQVAVRFAIVWLLLVLFGLLSHKKASIPRSKLPTAIAYSLLAAIAILFFTLSVQITTIANTLFMSNAAELIIAFLLGTFILKEKLNTFKIIAIILSLIGLSLYANSLFGADKGLLFALFAGVSVAVCNLLAKKLKGVDLDAIMRLQFGLGALFMAGLTLLLSPHDIVRTVSIEALVATIIFSIILIVATRFVLYGFQHFDVNIASVILSSQLAIGALLGYLIYHEIPTTNEIISGVLITSAAVLGSIGYKYASKKKS